MLTTGNPVLKSPEIPSVTLPKGGGAITGIGEKFQANAVTGTASLSVPLKISPGRGNFTPALSLHYDSGAGNGPFGMGWNIALPSVSRKTSKGIPLYDDERESDIFLWSDAEDLVPLMENISGEWKRAVRNENGFTVRSYRPRIESAFARIEKWDHDARRATHWRIVTRENVTSVYGSSDQSRIADPDDDTKVCRWLPDKTFDDKGNCIEYEYKKENDGNIAPQMHEQLRLCGKSAFTNRYLKRVKYGNTVPVDRQTGTCVAGTEWLFELVFDYGEHPGEIPGYEETETWSCRKDPFSAYRCGFEIRTYRLCKRVLLFHHFSELGNEPCLVASTDVVYDENPVASLISSIVHCAYRGNEIAKVPPLTFSYTQARIDPEIKTFDVKELQTLTGGVDEPAMKWVDLFGEGLTGILMEHKNAWWYKRNISASQNNSVPVFSSFETVAKKPSLSVLSSRGQQLTDLDGDGNVELVIREKSIAGYFEKKLNGDWQGFKPFNDLPNIDWNDPNLRWVDLTGDGHADVLLTEENCFTWYASKAKEGYDLPKSVSKALHEEHGPDLVFSDATQSIYLADMSGDGLSDIVRIRNGSVCYWPNKGYGRFGAKVSMDRAPLFDHPDRFDQKRIRIGDVDGTGTTDILYIGEGTIRCWTNQSGNSFSEAREISCTIPTDQLHTVSVVDLLGKGTSCIVFSNPYSPVAAARLRYIDLLSTGKPYLLSAIDNNMGAVSHMHYAPSTKFYLQAEQEGKPWISKLPFPVHVLEKTELVDEIGQNRFTTRYAYHHGYFDPEEREFRGFGLVEQWDTEAYNLDANGVTGSPEFFVPPVHIKSWYHTGFYQSGPETLRQYEEEYYKGDAESWSPAGIQLPGGLSVDELREAHRALKGLLLRQEIYAEDNSEKAAHPYSVSESSYVLQLVQPKNENRFASFLNLPAETLTYHYERNPADPRIGHQLVLETDRYGIAVCTATIGYPRRQPEFPEQGMVALTVEEKRVLHLDGSDAYYRLGIPVENKTFELTGFSFGGQPFTAAQLKKIVEEAEEISFEEKKAPLKIQKRLFARQRTTYYSDDLQRELGANEAAFHALPFRSYTKTFTPGLPGLVYGDRITEELLEEAGYVRPDESWWQPSDRVVFDAASFYLPGESVDPLGNRSHITYDAYLLFPAASADAMGNCSFAVYDYRVLQAKRVVDINDNAQEVSFDTRGMVTATAISGKNGEGDTLNDPTTKMEYELFRWMQQRKPNFVKTLAREQHGNSGTAWQISYSYSDGLGKEILKKVQAEDGEAFTRNADGSLRRDGQGQLLRAATDHRWIGNGRVVLNNKGKAVKQYEPYFTDTPDYEEENELREYGVSPVLHYDPVERLVLTDLPDGTFTKTEFDAWQKFTFDANDTVQESEWYLERGAPLPDSPMPQEPAERAAWLAAQHAGTPHLAHFDHLGREFLTVEDNGAAGKYGTRIEFDIAGKQRSITDAKGRIIARYDYDMAGRLIGSWTADAGAHQTLYGLFHEEAKEKGHEPTPLPFITWDNRQFSKRIVYDALHRVKQVWLTDPGDAVMLIECAVYGEEHPAPELQNLRGKPWMNFDQGGCTQHCFFDFKGNALEVQYRPAAEYKQIVDWQFLLHVPVQELEQEMLPALEEDNFISFHQYDALNRIVSTVHPDGTEEVPAYNKAGLPEKISARIKGSAVWTEFVRNIDYNAKAQRTAIYYGNDTKTSYCYDEKNFRLVRLFTTRKSDNVFLQDLHYTYDPVGNITAIEDGAQQTVFFRNAEVEASGLYEYDALYRLVKATGRELAGQLQTNSGDTPVQPMPQPGNTQALRTYTQTYSFDELGNILSMAHRAGGGNWKRNYRYKAENNHLLETSRAGDDEDGTYSDKYLHDEHGNMTQLPHLQNVIWNFHDQMQQVDLGGGGTAYYVYNSEGHRTRKVIERIDGTIIERFYFGGFELYRERRNETTQLERETFFIGDGHHRVAQVDTLTIEDAQPVSERTIRYQYSNHLGSATLELDENAAIISYEEYHPFGTSAYRSGRAEAEVNLKRYRYSGKERDEETGLYYYGARHLIAWLGRWSSADPAGFVDGVNVFEFVRNNVSNRKDKEGRQSIDAYFIHGTSGIEDTDSGRWSDESTDEWRRLLKSGPPRFFDWTQKVNRDGSPVPLNNYDNDVLDRNEAAQRLVKRLLKYYGSFEKMQNANIVLVGHSFGGDVAIQAAGMLSNHNIAVSVITIATPADNRDGSFENPATHKLLKNHLHVFYDQDMVQNIVSTYFNRRDYSFGKAYENSKTLSVELHWDDLIMRGIKSHRGDQSHTHDFFNALINNEDFNLFLRRVDTLNKKETMIKSNKETTIQKSQTEKFKAWKKHLVEDY